MADIPSVTYVTAGSTLLVSGTSFSYDGNGWVEILCDKLGVVRENKSFSGERINNLSARILNGTFFSQTLLNNTDALVIMHTHNKDVFTLTDLTINGNLITKDQFKAYSAADYEALSWGVLTDTNAGFNGLDGEFAAVWDYVLKKIQTIYYAERLNPLSVYYETKWGKPYNLILTTNWHDGRVTFNKSIRKLSEKWGIPLIKFDTNVGFSRFKKHISGVQHSLLYAQYVGGVINTETIDGELFAWHYERGQDKPLPKRLAMIARSNFEIL